MANVGDVLMTARADVGQAKQAFRSLQADVKQATADFRAGVIGVKDYQTAIQSARASAIDLRRAGLAPAGAELTAFHSVLNTATAGTEKARRGLGTMRGAFVGLAGSLVGVRGPLNAIVSGLLLFGTGGAVGAAVAAGLAGIALAFRKIGESAREAKEKVKEAVAAFAGIPEHRKVEQQLQLAAFEAQRDTINQRLKAQQTTLEGIDPLDPQRFAKRQAAETAIKRLQAQLLDVAKSVAATTHELNTMGETADDTRMALGRVGDVIKSRMDDVHRQVQSSRERMRDAFDNAELIELTNEALREEAERFKDIANPARQLLRDLERIAELTDQGFLFGPEEEAIQRALLGDIGNAETITPKKQQIKQQFNELGLDAAGAFTRGFIRSAFEGFQGFGQVLKNVFASIFEDAILQALRRALAKGGGSFLSGLFNLGVNVATGFATGGPGGAAAAGVGTVATGSGPFGHVAINVGPARDPISFARDSQWLRALAESNLALAAGGFRVVR